MNVTREESCYYLNRNDDETNATFTILQDFCENSAGLQVCQGIKDVPVFKVVNIGTEDKSKAKDIILGNPFMSQTMCISYCHGKTKYAILDKLNCMCYEGKNFYISVRVIRKIVHIPIAQKKMT